MSEETAIWQRRYQRERAAREEAERLLEDKSRELFLAQNALRSGVDAIRQGFLVIDAQRNVAMWNPRLIEMLPWVAGLIKVGAPPPPPTSWRSDASPFAPIPGVPENQTASHIEQALRSRTEPWDIHLADGRIIEVDSQPFSDFGRVLLFQDVTQQRKAVFLAELQSRAFAASIDGILIGSRDGYIESVNAAFLGMLGYQEREQSLIGRPTASLFSAHLEAFYYAEVKDALKREGFWRGEVEGLHADGRIIPLECSCTLLADGHLVIISRDLSEQKQQETELKRLKLALDESIEAVTIYNRPFEDEDGRLTEETNVAYFNRAMRDLLGPAHVDAFIKYGTVPQSAAMRDRFFTEIVPAIEQNGFWRGETAILRAEGEIPVEMSATRLPGEEGGVLVLSRDISERKQAEQEREALRTQLLQAQKQEAVGRLAGGIAHDFNNILAAIMGYSSLLAEDLPEGSEDRHAAEQILGSAERGADLVRQILSFSRREESEPEAVDLSAILREAASMLRATLPSSISFELDLPDTVCRLLARPTQLNQVLVNLCVNARDALADDGRIILRLDAERDGASLARHLAQCCQNEPQVFISVGTLDEQARYAVLTVSDSGSGIAPEIAGRLFEPFFTTKPVGKGSGLGLAAVHGIVTGHNGLIQIQSWPESCAPSQQHGTDVIVALPLAEDAVLAQAATGTAPAPRLAKPTAKGLRVLVVDDEPQVADAICRMLSRQGHTPTPILAPRTALSILKADPGAWDLIISDYTMPEITGTAMLEMVRDAGIDLPAILCTGFAEDSEPLRSEAADIAAILRKPVTAEDLSSAVEAAQAQAAAAQYAA